MSPLTKLVWFAEHEPATFAAVAALGRDQGARGRAADRRVGGRPLDRLGHGPAEPAARSTGTAEALAIAGIDADRLSPLVPTTERLALGAAAAAELGLEAELPVIVGAGDGPLANLGLGAVRPGVAACSIGTSGALRLMVERPAVDPQRRSSATRSTPGRWVVGGAINNGGVVLRWAGEALAPDLGDARRGAAARAGRARPARQRRADHAPLPALRARAALELVSRAAPTSGLTRHHGRGHLVRAALEGVCQQLALVLASMRDAGNEVHEIRATGGFARSALWRQMLADALGMPIGFAAGHEGSAFGAALLGMEALGLVEGIDRAARARRHRGRRRARPRRGGGLRRPAAHLRLALRSAPAGLPGAAAP